MTSGVGTSVNTVNVMQRLSLWLAVMIAVAVLRPSDTTSTSRTIGGPTSTARVNTACTERTDLSGKALRGRDDGLGEHLRPSTTGAHHRRRRGPTCR